MQLGTHEESNMKESIIITALAGVAFGFVVTAQAQEGLENNALNTRQKHLAAISCLEANGDQRSLAKEVDAAHDDGVKLNDIKEVFSQLYAYTGFPRSLNAIGTLQRVAGERAQSGKTTEAGRDADPLPSDYNVLRQGAGVQTRFRGGVPLEYSFAPPIDYYLNAHLFGDIFARNNLTHADREIVTVSALSALDGVEPQLKSHISGAINMGLSEAELRSIPLFLAERVGEAEAYRIKNALAAVFGEDFGELPPFDFDAGEPSPAHAEYFIGNSYKATLATGDGKLPVNNITFEPGCRNNWHVDNGFNQILICVEAHGWYQEWGKPAQALKPGDVVDIPAGVKHWHGAARTSVSSTSPCTPRLRTALRTGWSPWTTDNIQSFINGII